MSEALTINGRKLVPVREVVGRSRYTRDYISKLAREGVIVGAQVGRQWFVDELSLERFTEASELESEVRRRHLSVERRRERDLKQEVERQWDVIPRRSRYGRARAAVATVAVLCLGVISALALQQVPAVVVQIAALQKTQVAQLDAEVSPVVPRVATNFANELEDQNQTSVIFSDIATAETLTASSAILFVSDVEATSAADIAGMFADPVSVTFSAPGRGVVTGSSSAGTTSVPFVAVPVSVAHEGGSGVMPVMP